MSPLNAKDRKWLDFICVCSGSGASMYPGAKCEMIPQKSARKLSQMWLIEMYVPHNPVHKERWVITAAGRAALKVAKASIAKANAGQTAAAKQARQ